MALLKDRRRAIVLERLSSGLLEQGVAIAEELGVSYRTVYRDVEALRREGHDILSDRGCGYMIKKSAVCRCCGRPLVTGE